MVGTGDAQTHLQIAGGGHNNESITVIMDSKVLKNTIGVKVLIMV